MRTVFSIFLLFSSAVVTGQSSDSLFNYDFSTLWLSQKDRPVYGFVGEGYHRIRINIESVIKDKEQPAIYHVKGESQLYSSIHSFSGTITVTGVKDIQPMHYGVDDEYKNKEIQTEGILTAKYLFEEDKTDAMAGTFEGILASSWYVDKNGKLQYDDIERHADNYRNNQFEGTWMSTDGRRVVICNWGDFRIPNSGDLDIGVGEFSPSEKYLTNGWADFKRN